MEEYNIKENYNRGRIMNILRKYGKLTISQIVSMTKLTRPTIYLHLDVLELGGFINRKKDESKKGAPVTITVNNKYFPERETKTLQFLKLLKDRGDFISKNEYKDIGAPFLYGMTNSNFMGYIEEKMVLTKAGEDFLNKK